MYIKKSLPVFFKEYSYLKSILQLLLKVFLVLISLYLFQNWYIKFYCFLNLLLSTEGYFDIINQRQNLNIQNTPIVVISLVFYQTNMLFSVILSLFLILSLIVSAFLLKN